MTYSSGKVSERVGARVDSTSERSRGLKPAARGVVVRGRRGSVLVLVMTILSVLFVTGLAFMATMNFDAEMILAEKQLGKTQPGVESIIGDIASVTATAMIPLPGTEVADELVGFSAVSFAEMPGVHNLFAPIEPYWDNVGKTMRFRWVTDIAALSRTPFEGPSSSHPQLDARDPIFELDTQWVSGVEPDDLKDMFDLYPGLDFVPVDADGDGIVDSVQVELVDKPLPIDPDTGQAKTERFLVINGARLEDLRKALNPPSNPTGSVFLGLRIIAHGGMVDLNHAHELMIRTALWLPPYSDPTDYDTWLPQQRGGFKPYDVSLEEPLLRRRNLLPPRLLPPSEIQGSPLDPNVLTGGGDFSERLFPRLPRSETPADHRYHPFATGEYDRQGIDLLWTLRMDPTRVSQDPELALNSDYDWRHLVTTISHDDLLRRETWVEREVLAPDDIRHELKRTDVLELMIEANKIDLDAKSPGWDALVGDETAERQSFACWNRLGAGEVLPFEYAAYPHDDAAHRNTYHRVINKDLGGNEIDEGIYDGMLADWCKCEGDAQCTLNPVKGKLRLSLPWLEAAVKPDAFGNSVITEEQQIRLIQDAFTMMLLNVRSTEWGTWQGVDLDGDGNPDQFGLEDVDGDGDIDPGEGVPRIWDYAADALDEISRTAASLTANLLDFADADDEPTRVELRSADFNDLDDFGTATGEYVYGLERQPFITEVAAVVQDGADPDGDGSPNDPALYGEGIEFFNPYDEQIALGLEYELRVDGVSIDIPDDVEINGHGLFALYSGSDGDLVGTLPANSQELVDLLPVFNDESTIDLVRLGSPNVVVDQFSFEGSQIGEIGGGLLSAQRLLPIGGAEWTAAVPVDYDDADAQTTTHTLGWKSLWSGPLTAPVEVLFANTGNLDTAFPTTGSLLLLMRHANSETKAFTTYLDDMVVVKTYDPATGDIASGIGSSRKQLDNGRMPVFDVDYLHHLDPSLKDPDAVWPTDSDPKLTFGEPGGVRNLPWGQLVFDYFTALPLSNDGPYTDNGDWSIARVDEGGLRVHGRVNLNAAPWPVLAGLPFTPMDRIPQAFRDTFRDTLLGMGLLQDSQGDTIGDDLSGSLGPDLAKAIVAYRDAREIGGVTGDYDDPGFATFGRGWKKNLPQVRRGTGFLSVGELANVRHSDVTDPSFRIDSGEIVVNQTGSYLKAIAALAALGDWVTVRSQVFTIYGVLRGEQDETLESQGLEGEQLDKLRAADVNSRAIRFQETVDRLPTFIGERAVKRIGKRTVAKYNDFRND